MALEIPRSTRKRNFHCPREAHVDNLAAETKMTAFKVLEIDMAEIVLEDLIRRELGAELRRARKELDLRQSDISDMTPIHRRTVGNIESGENTNINNYIWYAQACQLDWGWLNTQVAILVAARIEAAPVEG